MSISRRKALRKHFWTAFLSVRGRLLQLILLSTLPALVFAVLLSNRERDAHLQRAQADISTYAGFVLRQHSYQVSTMKLFLKQIGDLMARKENLAQWSPDFFDSLLRSHPELLNLGLLTPEGEILKSAYPFTEHATLKNNPAFTRAVGSNNVELGDYIIGPLVKAPLMNLAYAVRDREGSIKNVIFCALDLRWPMEIIEKTKLPEDYVLYILNRSGKVLVEIDKKLIIPRDISLAELTSRRQESPVKLKVHGGQYYFSSAQDESSGLIVAIGFPYDKITAAANRSFLKALFNLALISFLTILSVFLMTEISILRVIRNLLSMAKRIGHGDLTSRINIGRGQGELYELAQEFNSMALSLQNRHEELFSLKNELKALSQHLQLSREEEARRMARELHDEFGQLLTAIKIELTRISKSQDTTEIRAKIDQAISTLRKICTELRPGVLDQLGTWSAIEWLVSENEERSEISINLCNSISEKITDDIVSVTIFRITQEALNNVVKHAHATTVNIDLSYKNDIIRLTIEDDGVGFDPEETRNKPTFGVLGMRERISLVGGNFELKSARGEGTTITATIPYRRNEP